MKTKAKEVSAVHPWPDEAGLFRAIFEQAAVGVALVDAVTGRFVKANQRYADIVGYSRRELEQLDFQALTHPDDLPIDLENRRRLLAGEIREITREMRYRRKDGAFVWVRITVAPFGASGEALRYHVAVVRDITEEKRMEQELQERAALAQFQAVVGAALAGQGELHTLLHRCAQSLVEAFDGALARIWTLNEAEQMLELQASAGMYTHLDGAHSRVPVGEFQVGLIARERKPHLTNQIIGDPRVSEQDWARREGMVAFAGYPLLVEERVVGVMVMFARHPLAERHLQAMSSVAHSIAITIERKRAEQALRESERRYRTLFEFSPAGILLEDDRGEILEFNDLFCGAFGYSREELRGQNVRLLVPPQDRHLVDRHFAEILAGKTLIHEVANVSKDGSLRQMELRERSFPLADGRTGVLVIANDITERTRAEEALRESEERYRTLFEGVLEGIAVADPATRRLLYVNPAYCAMYGYSPKELTQIQVDALHPQESLAQVLAEFEAQARGEKMLSTNLPCRKKDGGVFYADVSSCPVVIAGRPVLVGFFTDITERKRAEEALRSSERRLTEALRIASMGTWDYDTTSDQFTFNDQYYALHRTTAAAAGGYRMDSAHFARHFVHPEDAPLVAQAIALAQAVEAPDFEHRLEARILCADGDVRCIQVWFRIEKDDQGCTVGLHGVNQDITERKRAEEAQREARQLLRDVLDTVPVRVFWKDLEGRYLGCNLTNARDAGLASPEALIGKNDYELPWREQADVYRADDRRVIETGVPKLGFEETLTNSDGHRIWLRTSKIPLKDGEGRVIGILGTYENITDFKQAQAEREKLQAQLTQAQKMESIGRLAGGVAHDFNNMLQVILGNVSLALEQIPLDSPLRDGLEEVRKSGERSADLTRQLLAFARKQTIAPKVLDLNDTVAGMLKMLRRLIGEDIDLAWMPGANLWPVKVDPSQIDQVLANLCVNARDAIADTGKVTIETENVTLDKAYAATLADGVPGDYVMFAVSDNGAGMDAGTLSHLFEPFFTTKGVGKGTGLGLATVFGIVKQNQGLITVSSEVGRGTTFKIYLPRAEAKPAAPVSEAGGRALSGTETILVVEDEEQVLNLSRLFLQHYGYTVLTASAPESALALVKQHQEPIHLLISDVVMPGMNGKELRDRLLAHHPDLKCLFMSGYTSNVIAHHGVLDEGVDFLEKPFTNQTLAEKVREVLNR